MEVDLGGPNISLIVEYFGVGLAYANKTHAQS